MKDYDKNKESSYVKYWGANNLCGWAMLQKLPVTTFGWIKDTFQFNEEIYRYIMKKVMKDIFSKLMLNTLNIIFTWKRTKIVMNKPVYLGHSILELSKIIMYKFRYDYVKIKYGENAKLCYMDPDSFIVYIKTEDISKDIKPDNSNLK